MEVSTEFFETAKDSLNRRYEGPSIDNLYSATELAIQSILLLMHQGRFSIHQDHKSSQKIFAGYTTNGNLDPEYANHLSELGKLRKRGRYLLGLHNRRIADEDSEIQKRFGLTNELLTYIYKKSVTSL